MIDIHKKIQASVGKKILFLSHAIDQMNRPERMISPVEVRDVINQGIVIEDYLEDPRGHSCLLMGNTSADRVIHVVCSPKEDYLAIITAYLPSIAEWNADMRLRRRK